MSRTPFELACRCGDLMEGEVDAEPSVYERLLRFWNEEHSGDGHAPCTKDEIWEKRRHLGLDF